MQRPSPEFGERVRSVLEASNLSLIEVARRAKARGGAVSYGTVRSMTLGAIPSSDLIVDFAEAVSDNDEQARELADDLLRLARKRLQYARVTLALAV